MKRTVFMTLGLIAITFTACNTSQKENNEKATIVIPTEKNVVLETTSEFEENAFEDCKAYSETINRMKLAESAEEARIEDSIAAAAEAIKLAKKQLAEAERKRNSTPERLAERAKDAETWFATHYASLIQEYDPLNEGVRVRLNTLGEIYNTQILVNGKWKQAPTLLEAMTNVAITYDLEPGKAVAITVTNTQLDRTVALK